MEGAMRPNDRSLIFVKKKKKTHIEPKGIRIKLEQFNCSGVIGKQIL